MIQLKIACIKRRGQKYKYQIFFNMKKFIALKELIRKRPYNFYLYTVRDEFVHFNRALMTELLKQEFLHF